MKNLGCPSLFFHFSQFFPESKSRDASNWHELMQMRG